MLGHYKFGSTPEDRQNTDRVTADKYRSIMEEWRAVQAVIQQRDKENEVDGVSTGSTGSRDEVFEQLQMISSGMEKSPTMVTKRGSIEEPDIEGLDTDARARLFNGHLSVGGENNEENRYRDCASNEGKFSKSSTCRENCASEVSGNGVHLPNGHDTGFAVDGQERIDGSGLVEPALCQQ